MDVALMDDAPARLAAALGGSIELLFVAAARFLPVDRGARVYLAAWNERIQSPLSVIEPAVMAVSTAIASMVSGMPRAVSKPCGTAPGEGTRHLDDENGEAASHCCVGWRHARESISTCLRLNSAGASNPEADWRPPQANRQDTPSSSPPEGVLRTSTAIRDGPTAQTCEILHDAMGLLRDPTVNIRTRDC